MGKHKTVLWLEFLFGVLPATGALLFFIPSLILMLVIPPLALVLLWISYGVWGYWRCFIIFINDEIPSNRESLGLVAGMLASLLIAALEFPTAFKSLLHGVVTLRMACLAAIGVLLITGIHWLFLIIIYNNTGLTNRSRPTSQAAPEPRP